MRQIPIRDADQYIARRMSFNTYGALSGRNVDRNDMPIYTGQLPARFVDQFRADQDEIDYVVFSYVTPIAWHVNGKGWVVPDTKYSVTTSKHQGKARSGIHQSGRPETMLT